MGYMFEQGVEKVMRDIRIFRIFEGTNDILRLMVGLQGLQYTGQALTPVADAAKNIKQSPISSSSTLLKYKIDQTLKAKGRRSKASDDLQHMVHPQLKNEAVKLGEAITRFEVVAKELLQKFTKDIIHKQFHVKRIADATLEIYASAAVLSRATAAQNHPHSNKETEITLAQIYVFESLKKIHAALDQIASEDEAHWDRMTALTMTMIDNEESVGVHPTELIN